MACPPATPGREWRPGREWELCRVIGSVFSGLAGGASGPPIQDVSHQGPAKGRELPSPAHWQVPCWLPGQRLTRGGWWTSTTGCSFLGGPTSISSPSRGGRGKVSLFQGPEVDWETEQGSQPRLLAERGLILCHVFSESTCTFTNFSLLYTCYSA